MKLTLEMSLHQLTPDDLQEQSDSLGCRFLVTLWIFATRLAFLVRIAASMHPKRGHVYLPCMSFSKVGWGVLQHTLPWPRGFWRFARKLPSGTTLAKTRPPRTSLATANTRVVCISTAYHQALSMVLVGIGIRQQAWLTTWPLRHGGVRG